MSIVMSSFLAIAKGAPPTHFLLIGHRQGGSSHSLPPSWPSPRGLLPLTSSFLAIANGAPHTDFRIREFVAKGLGGVGESHLDWFLSTVWKMVSKVEVEPRMRTDINNMLTSSTGAVNQLAHMQVPLLAGNA